MACLARLLLACALFPTSALAETASAWRSLTADEERARAGDVVAESLDPAAIEGDFDGDGKKDRAEIMVRTKDMARGLLVSMKGASKVVATGDGVSDQDGLGLAEPGPWDTVCGNAFREFHQKACEDGYPSRLTLKNPGILLIGNGRTMLYFWNPKKKAFGAVVMVD